MEIVSYFTQVLSIEIFIKGFFFSICLSLGLFMILSDQRSYFNDVHNFKSYRDKLRLLIQNYFKKITIAGFLSSNNDPLNKWNELRFPLIVNSLTFGILFFVAALVFGSLIHSISHKWISYESKFHLGLKDFWNPASLTRFYSLFNQECDEKGMKRANTNDLLKVKSFCDIFGDISSLEMCNSSNGCFEIKEIKEIYYRARHELLTKDVWREYLLSTEKLVGISESFAFSFYILFWLCYINFFINLFRDIFDKRRDSSLAIFLPLFLFLSINFLITAALNSSKVTPWIFILFPVVALIIVSIASGQRAHVSIYYSITSVILIYVSSLGYVISSKAWVQNCLELHAKTFGVFRYHYPSLQKITNDKISKILHAKTELSNADSLFDNSNESGK